MEEQEGGDAVDWREAFDDLLVFEQDFDTAMQILMFQDEKVARLSLEEPSLTMRRTGRRAKSRTSARSSSKKRRRTEASEAAREEPPIPPLGSCTQSSGLWSSVANSAEEEEATQAPWTQQYSSVEMQEYAAPQFDEAYEDVGAPGTGETGGKPSETGRNARVNGAATTAVSSSDGANREKGNSSVGTSPTAVSSLFQTRSGKVATVSSGHVEEVGANVMFEGNNVEVAANLGECFSAQNREHKVQVTTGALTVNSQNLQPDDVDFSKASGPAYFPDDAENNAAKVQYRCHRVSTIGKNNSGATVSSLFQTAAGDTVAISKARLTDYTEKLFKELSPDPQPLQTTTVTNPHHANRCHTMASTLFTTGSGKAVSVSKVRLQAYEAKLRSEEEMVAASTTSERRDVHGAGGGVNAKADSAATVPSLFQTGSGKAVSVSKVRLQAYEAKLRSEEEMVAASTTSERRDVHGAGGGVNAKADSAATVPSLFQTGSGKAVSVSKVRLQAYEAKLRSEEEMVAASTTSERRDVHGAGGGVNAKADSAATVPSLFQTGSGKAVSVSKVRLQAYEAKLRSEEEMVAASTTSERRDVHGAGGGVNAKADSAATVPSLFQTGSGKAVSVSKVRLQAYEAKLRSEEEMVAASTTSERRDVHGAGGGVNAKADSAATVPSLFQTGSGKAVSVSKVRLQAYEAKLRSEEEMVAASTTSERRDVHGAGGGVNAKADSAATVPSLFQTGSGKAVSVSKVRLQAYEAKLRSEEEMVAASTTSERRDVHGAGGGVNAKADSAATVPSLFQTGSGKAVSVSKVRLQAYEAKLRSEEEMVAASTTSERRDVHGAGGGVNAKADSAATVPSLFQTGSGKAVSVSKVRLQAYEAKLRSEEEMVAASTTSERRDVHGAGGGVNAKADSAATVPSLFQTGSGKAVSVSKVRLQAYEAKLRSEEEMVAASTTSERRDVHGAGGGVNAKADSAATVPSLFQTGSGKAVSVSKVQLQAYEAKLRSEEEPMSDEGRGAGSVSGDIEVKVSRSGLRNMDSEKVSGSSTCTRRDLNNAERSILKKILHRDASSWKNPLLAKEDLTQWPYLLLRYNSTRRARFETRLGVEKLHFMIPTNPRARKQQPQLTFSMLKSVPLKSLEVGGGMVRSVRIRVTRISPVLHLQANEWTLGPRILCEEQLPTYFQLRSEYGRASMQRKIQQHGVGSGAEDWLNDDQIDVPPPIPFIKMDVECTHPSNGNQGVGCGILTVWRPSEELLSSVLREGAEYFASSLTVNWKVDGGRGQDAFVRLGSTKHSGFEEVHDDLSLDDKEAKGTAQLKRNQRVCVDVQQATTDYRANFESDRRNERRPTIDVCVCVVLVTTRETQDGSSIAAKRQAEVSLLDPTIKPKESRYVEHVFVTDKSRHLMSIRVSGMEVSMLKKKTSPLKRGSSSSFAFRRGSKRIWKEGAVLCLSGLEVSHYDEQLRVLDCVLVESTQIVSFPSKNSPFWNHFQCLQREAGISTSRRSASEPTSSEFFEELAHLKKYVERDILRMDFVPSQECDEHYVEVVEQERLTQDLQAHEGGGEQTNESSGTVNRHLRWDGTVVKILPLPGSSKFIFPRNVIALVCICIRTDDNAFRSVYLTQEAVISMQALLQGTDVEKQLSLKEGGPTEDDAALVLCTMKMLNKTNADKTFQFEVRQATNERLINSWKPWDRLHASYWVANTVTSAPPPTD
ncbi:hypothetical protein KRP22_003182 [Phytophthora ramorum]|nr:hypothetical protein KRP22_6833 [Phytophthora ramorum]